MSIETWENEGGPCLPETEEAKVTDPFIVKLHEDWSKCSFCGRYNGSFGKSLQNHNARCRYIGPANEQRMARCLECKSRKKDVIALVVYKGEKEFIARKDKDDYSALWVNRLWCADHTPEHCIETDKKKYKPVIKPSPWDLLKEWQKELDENKVANTPIKPDPIIFVENFGSWVGEWRVGRKGRQAIEDVYRQYKLSASSR